MVSQDIKFNFVFDGKHTPNYRVEYETKSGAPSVSSPAIFANDADAIESALHFRDYYGSIGLNVVKVQKYEKSKCVEIFRLVY